MSQCVIAVKCEPDKEPAVFFMPKADVGLVRERMREWISQGVFVKEPDGGYTWHPPGTFRVAILGGDWPPNAFSRYEVTRLVVKPAEVVPVVKTEAGEPVPMTDSVPPAVAVAANPPAPAEQEQIQCPHCGEMMVPGKVTRGPTVGMPKCTKCAKTIRPTENRDERVPVGNL